MASEELIKTGKKAAAALLKAQCTKIKNPDLLNEVLDIILNPEKSINDDDSIEWIEWLIAGGQSPDEFKETVKSYDSPTTCGLVWTANFVAYRCRTCGISPCMSLCAECFQQGNHDGHDFNMFRSQAGGACDCGDTSVMKDFGFCPKHGPSSVEAKPSPPSNLICMAEALMPRLILRLIIHFREKIIPWKEGRESFYLPTAGGEYLAMLQKLMELGTSMRRVMTEALINPQPYSALAAIWFSAGYLEAMKSLPTVKPSPDLPSNNLTSSLLLVMCLH